MQSYTASCINPIMNVQVRTFFYLFFLFQIALQFHSIGEKPLSLRGNFVSVNASLHSVSSSPPTVAINGMSFQLSRGVISTVRSSLNIYGKEEEGEKKESISTGPRKEVISGNNQWSQTRSSCYQTRSILFLRNPFAFMAKGNDMVSELFGSLYCVEPCCSDS